MVPPSTRSTTNDKQFVPAAEHRDHTATTSNDSMEAPSSRSSTCAYPSWPTGPSLDHRSAPSSYISDADLFGEDFDDDFACPFLDKAPAPPRVYPIAQAMPVLPPLYAPKKFKSSRQRSKSKQRHTSNPMEPIPESSEQAE